MRNEIVSLTSLPDSVAIDRQVKVSKFRDRGLFLTYKAASHVPTRISSSYPPTFQPSSDGEVRRDSWVHFPWGMFIYEAVTIPANKATLFRPSY